MSGLDTLMANLGELEGIPSRIAAKVSERLTDLLFEEFEEEHDPYGAAWAPLLPQTVKRKRGDDRILRRTDALSIETVAHPRGGAGIEISSLDYGRFHQTGTRHMVARPVLPGGDELPDSWQAIIEEETEAAFSKRGKR